MAERDGKGGFVTAAAIPRTHGRSETYLKQVTDFTDSNLDRKERIALYHQIYNNEGLVNNAVNKYAALIATDGNFKVRYVKGQRGRGADKPQEELRVLLQWWEDNVNARADDAVLTGARGVHSYISQSTRLALIEGSSVARTLWKSVKVPTLGNKPFKLPINIQMFSTAHIESAIELAGFDVELLYYAPPQEFIKRITEPKDPNVKELIQKYMDAEVLAALKKDKRYLLDPALLMHVKNRPTGIDVFGSSMIQPAMSDVAYKRALQALDVVTIENLINRLVIVKVGSDNVESLYHAPEAASARLQLLQRMFQRLGPSVTVLWPGPDIDVVEVGAHGKILEMDERYKIAETRIRGALGVPSALLTGDSPDGKSSGLAGAAGAGAQLVEYQSQYVNNLTQLAERIAVQNGFEDVVVAWEFAGDLLQDKEVNSNVAGRNYDRGLYSTRTALEEMGQDYESEEVRQHEDVKLGYKEKPFGPPLVVTTTNVGGENGGQGRPSNEERPGETDPRKDKETQTTEENK
jgi:hypothetical protein